LLSRVTMKALLILATVLALGLTVQADGFYRQEPIWSYSLNGKANSVTALNESILVGAESGVYALDYDKGLLWFDGTQAAVTAVSSRGNIVAAESDGTVLLLNRSGGIIWERQIPGYVGYDEAIDIWEGDIVCGSMDGFIYSFDNGGTFKWKHLIGSYVTNVKIVNDTIVAGSDRQVYLLDLDGRVRRNLGLSGFIRSFGVTDNVIAVGMDDGRLYGYDLRGNLRFSSDVGENIDAMDASGGIVLGTKEGHLMLFREDGRMLWKTNVTSGVIAVKSDGENILASTMGGKVELYDMDGLERWYYEPNGKATALSINGKNIVSGTSVGKVYYSRLIKRDSASSFMISVAVVLVIGAAILVVGKSWK
jgi:hypothetical protein